MLATAFGLAALGAPAPSAHASPAAPGPVLAAPADDEPESDGIDDDRDADRPVRIDVGRFEPRTVTPGSVVTVTGLLTNTGDSPITDLSLRLQRGEPVTSRAELAASEDDRNLATAVLPPFQELSGELPPGGELEFTYTVPAEELRLEQDGVYPVLINVNGTENGLQRRVGELPTFVVRQPTAPARTTVAWLWPLVERTHRTPSGEFRDDGLTDAIADGGRLDRALAVVERLPRTVPAGQTDPVPALTVTLAVDPALVEELTIMAAGPYTVDGVQGAGRGTEEAAAWLERLRVVAEDHPVVALSYGDVDADALTAAGLPDVLLRTLPGTVEGTAEDFPGDLAPTGGTPTAGPPGGAGAPDLPDRSVAGAGARILAEALDVPPVTDLAWPAGDTLRADTLAVLQSGGADRVVLDPTALAAGESAVGLHGGAAAAAASLATPAGPLEALVADRRLADIVGSAEQAPGGPRMAEQRYLAELAVLDLQAPAAVAQTVLVAPRRIVEAGPDGAGAMMAATTSLPWLRAGTVEELSQGPATAAGGLVDPVGAPTLDATGMADVAAAVALRNDLAGAVVGDADAALAAYDAGIGRTTSASWRSDPEGFRGAAVAARTSIDRLRGRVTLLAPAEGTYSLASSDAPLVLTVRNDLPFAVQVLLDVRTRGNRGLSIGDLGTTTLVPGERTTLQVPTEVRQSGGFAVTAELTTPSGGVLGEPVHMQVKSTAYGSISLLITFGAAALLALLFLRRLVLFVLRRRRAAAAGGSGPGAAEEIAGTLPPTRSPV